MAELRKSLTTVNPINPDDVKIKKRKNIEGLPAIFQTEVSKKFFASSVDQVFQPQSPEELVGYIGSIPSYYDNLRDFYIQEPNQTRSVYQLTSSMISKNINSNEFQRQLFYDDLINYLRFKGGIIDNHTRLFGQDYYSWAPPIDFDKFMNYRDYFWLPFGPEAIVITEVTNLAAISGNKEGKISYNGGEIDLSSGMILYITNDDDLNKNGKYWIVEGVGRSIAFIENNTVIGGWDLELWDTTLWDEEGEVFLTPDYITMERGCDDRNQWSRSNKWFHRDVITNFYDPNIVKTQASRPIIEFEKNLELNNFGIYDRGKVDLVVKDCPTFYKIIQGITPGWDGVLWDSIYSNSNLPICSPKTIGSNQSFIYGSPDIFTTGTQINSLVSTELLNLKANKNINNSDIDLSEMVISFALDEGDDRIAQLFNINNTGNNNAILSLNPGIYSSDFNNLGLDYANILFKINIIIDSNSITGEQPNNNGTLVIDSFISISFSNTLSINSFSISTNLEKEYRDKLCDTGISVIGCNITVKGWDDNWPLSPIGYSEIYVEDEFGDNVQIRDGMRILLVNDQDPGINGKIVEVTGIQIKKSIILQTINNGLDPLGDPRYNERVMLKSPSGKSKIYWFNGEEWVEGQFKSKLNQAPLFNLYDIDKNRLDDLGVYPNSSFSKGNKIFSYAEDDLAPIDPVLGLRLSRNSFNEIVFNNNLITDRYSYGEDQEILGYYFHKIFNTNESKTKFGNNWHLVPEKSKQYYTQKYKTFSVDVEYPIDILPLKPYTKRTSALKESIIVKLDGQKLILGTDYTLNEASKSVILLADSGSNRDLEISILSDETPVNGSGTYNVPINLEANPNNDEISSVGFNQLFDHFYSIIGGQQELVGNQFSRNNYRDTSKDKFYGDKILQHSAPLLKTMALATSTDIDIINSIKYSEKEYVRFKNKFIQKITYFINNNILLEYDSVNSSGNTTDEWVNLALKEINIAKSLEVPFKNTGMGSLNDLDRTFIPPTPAFLGILKAYEPKIILDTMFEPAVTFIQGHDGSLTPTFDDFRDEVLLDLEQRIYNSIPTEFKNEKLSKLPIYNIIPGKFRKTEYSIDEINKVLKPNFELWSAQAGVNYKTYSSSTENDFDINYRSVKDKDNEIIPGHARGIYFWYYDTDRPNSCPWEMLGFSEEPDWWIDEYGVTPYTSGNIKLWSDLEQGLIRQGERKGIDSRFARPGLTNIIPVSTTGDLLTPLEAGIIKRMPSSSEAISDWIFGDYGPIETAWRKSEFFTYDLTQLLFLLKPNSLIDIFWDSKNTEFVSENYESNLNNQIITNNYKLRPKNKNLIMHDEPASLIDDVTSVDIESVSGLVRVYGVQQFVSNYLESQGKNITQFLGDIIRGLNVQLSHKAAGFIDQQTLRLDSDSFGKIPNENIDIELYKSNSVKEVFYGGVIVERTDKGYKVYGYDILNPVFKTIPGDTYGRKTKIGIGIKGNPFEIWQPKSEYVRGDIVFYESNSNFYRCSKDHISGTTLDAENWVRISNPPTQYQLEVTKFLDPIKTEPVVEILYGTEYGSIQDVFNLLIDYERYLVKEGFIFDTYSSTENDIIDWTWVGKEFMSWTLGSPDIGEIVALSPAAQKVKFKSSFGYIEPVEQIIQGIYSILNRDGIKIDVKDTAVSRYDDQIEIIPVNPQNTETLLYSVRLFLTEIEHSIIIDNTTIFNDIVYDPLFNIKQNRLKLNAVRAKGWSGKYEAAGFIITDTQLLPNYDKLADQFRYIFDLNKDNLVEKTWRTYGYHDIGYQNRDYLDNLIISEKSQLNFYQGMIRQKGTQSSFNKLLRSEFITKTSDLFFFEEWAFRIGQFGDYDKKPSLEIFLSQKDYSQNPQRIDFNLINIPETVETGTMLPASPANGKTYFYNTTTKELFRWDGVEYVRNNNWHSVASDTGIDLVYDDVINIITIKDENGAILGGDSRWERRPDTTVSNLDGWIWKNRPSEYGNPKDLPNAGYVKLDEVTYYAFDAPSTLTFYEKERAANTFIADGEVIWVYDTIGLYGYNVSGRGSTKYTDSWSTFRITEINRITPINIEITEDRASVIITFNSAVALFDYNGNPLPEVTPVSSSPIIVSADLTYPVPGTITTSSNTSSVIIDVSALVFVSTRTQTTISTEVSIVSVNNSDFVSIASADCAFRPAFEDNVFVIGASPNPSETPVEDNNEEDDGIVVNPNSFNIIDVNDVIFFQTSSTNPYEHEATYVVEEILSPTTIRASKPVNLSQDISLDSLIDLNITTNTYILKETRFHNTAEFNTITNSVLYKNDYFNSFNNTLFYIDDSRTANESIKEPYYNVIKITNWNSNTYEVSRSQTPKVDTNKIYNAIIYNKNNNNVNLKLEIYDPFKGIIPGVADREIWYKSDYDPAKYTVGNTLLHNISPSEAWGKEQVGRVWWDLKRVRFLDYELSDNSYRRNNWGVIAPGSSIDVYEWVRSSIAPNEYQIQALQNNSIPGGSKSNIPSGEVYSINTPAYSAFQEYDEKTKSIKIFYYFWVKNKITIPDVGFRNISALSVKNIIENPTAAGINWFSPINNDSIIAANIYQFLNTDESILQVNWSKDEKTENHWHKQWILGREGDPGWAPESIIYDKMIDSLVGYDRLYNAIPDIKLNDIERYGVLVRPRQTMFVDKTKARFNFIEFFNTLLEKINYLDRLNAYNNILKEDQPTITTNYTVNSLVQRDFLVTTNIVNINETVLVTQIPEFNNFWSIWKLTSKIPVKWELVEAQQYKTSDFINIADWYGVEVDKSSPPLRIFNDIDERNEAISNEIIAVNEIYTILDYNNEGIWVWEKYIGPGDFEIVAKQAGTISLSNKFFNNDTVYGINENWSLLSETDLKNKINARDGSLELKELLKSIRYDENTFTVEECNLMFFNMIKYAHSENQIIDWAFKTSYILFGGTIEALSQDAIVRPVLFNSMIDYITEVKPYHVKFREFARRIATAIDSYNTNVTDFDMPPYYDEELGEYRILDINNPDDLIIISSTKPWSDWYENYQSNPSVIRNITIKQKFDRISCSPSDNEPLSIKIFSNGSNTRYELLIDGSSVLTNPSISNYDPYKYFKPQIWSSEHIDNIIIKDNINGDVNKLSNSDWRIEEELLSNGKIGFVLYINTIPPAGNTIEITRKVHAADRINRFYQPIDNLWNGKAVSHIIPNKFSPGLISGCDFNGTIVEGGNYKLTNAAFQQVAINYLAHIWDLLPNYDYNDETKEYLVRYLNIYNQSTQFFNTSKKIWNLDDLEKYILDFIKVYAWDTTPWDGYPGVDGNVTLPNNIPITDLLYDAEISGGVGSVSGTPWTLNNSEITISVEGNKFIQPDISKGRPEELVGYRIIDPLLIDVYTSENPGSPKVYYNIEFSEITANDIFRLPGLAQSREAVFVYVNDLLLIEGKDYEIDWNYQFIRMLVSFSNPNSKINIVSYSTGGGDNIILTKYLKSDQAILGNSVYDLQLDNEIINNISVSSVFVTYNGYITPVTSVSNGLIGIDTYNLVINDNNTVIFSIYNGTNKAVIRREDFSVSAQNQSLILKYVSGPETPIEQSTLVFNNGKRVLGPLFKYYRGNNIDNLFDTEVILKKSFSVIGEEFNINSSAYEDFKVLINNIPNNNWRIYTQSWQVSAEYEIGDVVNYNFNYYRCKENHTSTNAFSLSGLSGTVNPSSVPYWSLLSTIEGSTIEFFTEPSLGDEILIQINNTSFFKLESNSLEAFDSNDFDEMGYDEDENAQNSFSMNIIKNIPIPSTLSVITFNDNTSMKIKTEFFKGVEKSEYPLFYNPFSEYSIWASVSGFNKSYTIDFDMNRKNELSDSYIYNTSYQPFVSSKIVWDNVYLDEISNFSTIKFKDSHLSTIKSETFLDFANVGFDKFTWDVSGFSSSWDNIQPTIGIVKLVPGFDNDEEELFDTVGFDLESIPILQDDVYVTYMTGFEKTEGLAIRNFNNYNDSIDMKYWVTELSYKKGTVVFLKDTNKPYISIKDIPELSDSPANSPDWEEFNINLVNKDKEFIRIADAHKLTLKTEISAGSNSFEVYENIELLPALIADAPLMDPNISENIPGVIWINGERIEYWQLDGPVISSGRRYWTISNLSFGTKNTTNGIDQLEEYFYFTGNSATTEFYVDPGINDSNTIVQLYKYEPNPGIWDIKVSEKWDTFEWDEIPVRAQDITQSIITSADSLGDYIISAASIKFNVAPPIDKNSPRTIVYSSGGTQTIITPIPNILVTKINSNWLTSNTKHLPGSIVFSGNLNQVIPGGYDPNYNNLNRTRIIGLQYQDTVQTEFLKNRVGRLNKP